VTPHAGASSMSLDTNWPGARGSDLVHSLFDAAAPARCRFAQQLY